MSHESKTYLDKLGKTGSQCWSYLGLLNTAIFFSHFLNIVLLTKDYYTGA
jgi:hypothetical protein